MALHLTKKTYIPDSELANYMISMYNCVKDNGSYDRNVTSDANAIKDYHIYNSIDKIVEQLRMKIVFNGDFKNENISIENVKTWLNDEKELLNKEVNPQRVKLLTPTIDKKIEEINKLTQTQTQCTKDTVLNILYNDHVMLKEIRQLMMMVQQRTTLLSQTAFTPSSKRLIIYTSFYSVLYMYLYSLGALGEENVLTYLKDGKKNVHRKL